MTYYGVTGCYAGALVLTIISSVLLCSKKPSHESTEEEKLPPLHQLAKTNVTKEKALKTISQLKAAGQDINYSEYDTAREEVKVHAPMTYALMEGNRSVIEALFEEGAELRIPIHWLAYATQRSQAELEALIDFLLSKAPNALKERDLYGQTPLHWAMCHANLNFVRALLAKGVPTEADNQGDTPLHALADCPEDAISNRRFCELIEAVSPQHIPVLAKNRLGYTPCEWAILCGGFNLCTAFLGKVALPPNAMNLLGGMTNLDEPLAKKFLQLFLSKGMKIDTSWQDTTPLQCAAFYGNLPLVKVLCQMQANPNIVNQNGNALHHAVLAQQQDWKMAAFNPVAFTPETTAQIIEVLRKSSRCCARQAPM